MRVFGVLMVIAAVLVGSHYALTASSAVNSRNEMLLTAASMGDVQSISRQLADGAEVDGRDRTQVTALMYAAAFGKPDAVRMLLEAGASTSRRSRTGWDACMLAAAAGRADSLTELIRGGADVNAATSTGRTALMFAASNGHAAAVRVLLDAGARSDAVEPATGISALDLAREGGSPECVELLLGADRD